MTLEKSPRCRLEGTRITASGEAMAEHHRAMTEHDRAPKMSGKRYPSPGTKS